MTEPTPAEIAPKTRDAILGALSMLCDIGGGADDIAEALSVADVTGQPWTMTGCPLAVWVQRALTSHDVEVDGVYVRVLPSPDVPDVEIKLTEPFRRFAARFDGLLYPWLITQRSAQEYVWAGGPVELRQSPSGWYPADVVCDAFTAAGYRSDDVCAAVLALENRVPSYWANRDRPPLRESDVRLLGHRARHEWSTDRFEP